MTLLDNLFNPELIAATLRISAPLVLAALGGLLSMRARIFNIALEGFMLIGAFFSIAVVEWSNGNVWLGLLGGLISGVIVSLLYALIIIQYKADQIIVGIAINLFAFGLTSFLLRALFDTTGAFTPNVINKIPNISVPILKDIPYLGEALANHSPMVYFTFILAIVTYILLFHTPFGLAVQSVGEEPESARTAGINPNKIRFLTIIWSGAFSGLAGAHLSTAIQSQFIENMVQGRGFTSFTAIVFGLNHPIGTFFASLLFGFADALGIRIEILGSGIPASILKMFPYFLAILAIIISSIVRSRKQTSLTGRVF